MNENRRYQNFVLQQGIEAPDPASCRPMAAALLFQPRLVAPVLLVATVLQNAPIFIFLAGLQWWNALVPALNPFDACYRLLTQGKPGAVPLPIAPPPRRFAMAMAGTFAGLTGLAMLQDWRIAAYVLQAFLVIAVTAVALGGLCLGSFLYHVFRGKGGFAVRTLPWGRGV